MNVKLRSIITAIERFKILNKLIIKLNNININIR